MSPRADVHRDVGVDRGLVGVRPRQRTLERRRALARGLGLACAAAADLAAGAGGLGLRVVLGRCRRCCRRRSARRWPRPGWRWLPPPDGSSPLPSDSAPPAVFTGELALMAVWSAFADDPASWPVPDFWPLPWACPAPPPPIDAPPVAVWVWVLFWVVPALLPAPLAAPLMAPWLALLEPPDGLFPEGLPPRGLVPHRRCAATRRTAAGRSDRRRRSPERSSSTAFCWALRS